MDDESKDTLLRAGDVLIQRSNNHAWSNRGTEPCVIAFVLIDVVKQCDAPNQERKGMPVRN